MKIIDLLDKKSIKLNLNSKTKSEAIEELVDLVANSGNLNDKENYSKANETTNGEGSSCFLQLLKLV
ncbi:PTS system, fructose-specific IIABC component domain protein [Clostridioides difficile DA00165]|nr:PTS system, fructose-specific IIABC component domain protein [Clostridioides difficile DA00165]